MGAAGRLGVLMSFWCFSPNSVSTLRGSYGRGRCLIRVLTLGRGIFPVNFLIKWLLWNLDMHFDYAGSHTVCFPVFLLNILPGWGGMWCYVDHGVGWGGMLTFMFMFGWNCSMVEVVFEKWKTGVQGCMRRYIGKCTQPPLKPPGASQRLDVTWMLLHWRLEYTKYYEIAGVRNSGKTQKDLRSKSNLNQGGRCSQFIPVQVQRSDTRSFA